MRRIQLHGNDASLFAHDLTDADLDFYQGHKDTFKRMWQDQGKSFWVRFVISFRWQVVNHGVLAEFPGKREDFDAIVDQAFIYIHDNIVDGKISQAQSFLIDMFVLALNKGAIKYLEVKTKTMSRARDPFYSPGTRDVFRRLFGDPLKKISYVNVYFTLPMFVFFGGSLVQCLRLWMEAPELVTGDDSYWEPPQKHDPPALRMPPPQLDEPRRNNSRKIPATTDGRFVDHDYKVYLEEKMKGHHFGPLWLPKWDFGDPRFVDENNPLYDLTADTTSDWRVNLTFSSFRRFYDYVIGRDISVDMCAEFTQYHPDVVVFPPPAHRRVYDEIERSFLESCEKYYKLGVAFPAEKLSVDEYHTKDIFYVYKHEACMAEVTLVENGALPFPTPNIFPPLGTGAHLLLMRRHVDEQGLFNQLVPDAVTKPRTLSFICAQIFGRAVAVNSSGGTKKETESLPIKSQWSDMGSQQPKRKAKKSKKPKLAQRNCSTVASPAANGVMVEAQQGAVSRKPTSAYCKQHETKLRQPDSSSCPHYEDPKVPGTSSYSKFEYLQERGFTELPEVLPLLLRDSSAQFGGPEVFECAWRKATRSDASGCGEPMDAAVTDPFRLAAIDGIAGRIAKVLAQRREAQPCGSGEPADDPEQLAEMLANLVNVENCRKVDGGPTTTSKSDDISELHSCTNCGEVEPEAQTYKMCQRCKTEEVNVPRYYCSVNCQTMDWKKRHRTEHNEKLMETKAA